MNSRRHTRLTAWPGLLAIWLGLVAPVVTQILPERADAVRFVALCSTHAVRMTADDARDSEPGPFTHAKWCGYCGLLAHHLPLAGGSIAAPHGLDTSGSAVVELTLAFQPAALWLPGRPRGPPVRLS